MHNVYFPIIVHLSTTVFFKDMNYFVTQTQYFLSRGISFQPACDIGSSADITYIVLLSVSVYTIGIIYLHWRNSKRDELFMLQESKYFTSLKPMTSRSNYHNGRHAAKELYDILCVCLCCYSLQHRYLFLLEHTVAVSDRYHLSLGFEKSVICEKYLWGDFGPGITAFTAPGLAHICSMWTHHHLIPV